MTEEVPHLPRIAILAAIARGRIKAQRLLLMENRTLEEYRDILAFIQNSGLKELELKNNKADDVRMSDILPGGKESSIVRKLKEGGEIETVQDLLRRELRFVRTILSGEPVLLLESILAMHPNTASERYVEMLELSANRTED